MPCTGTGWTINAYVAELYPDGRIENRRPATGGFDDIQKTPDGYAMLARVITDRNLEPPQHGDWFFEVGGNGGGLLREVRIEPAAERLEAKFETFMPTADGGLLVAGVRRADVIAMATDPTFQALTTCMSGCAMQYAPCP